MTGQVETSAPRVGGSQRQAAGDDINAQRAIWLRSYYEHTRLLHSINQPIRPEIGNKSARKLNIYNYTAAPLTH